ncbi:MAG: PhoH family protein, partial [Chitinophagales bacterium]
MPEQQKAKKIFVIDTSVILYNHTSILSFADNDVAIPITVLEELDNFKKGNEIKNFEAREFIRTLDKLSGEYTITNWTPLNGGGKGKFKVILNETGKTDSDLVFGGKKADHKILNAALKLAEEEKDKKVILVSKDINLRLKAKALNLTAEDFETGKVKNIDELFKGKSTIDDVDPEVISAIYKDGFCAYKALFSEEPIANHYYILKNEKKSVLAYYNPSTEMLERIEKRYAYHIKPRNAEQVFALHSLFHPDVKVVTLQGVSGTGKTLLALSAALEQAKQFSQIFLARPIVPLSNKDIGYLPGDIKSKINPYMEPMWDNLKFIKGQFKETERSYKKIESMLEREKLLITPLAYIRGRSISNVYFIVDEAQNLTPHEIKTIITRAGDDTKIVFTGDINQIDTPYLDSQSNGLSYLIDKFKGQD